MCRPCWSERGCWRRRGSREVGAHRRDPGLPGDPVGVACGKLPLRTELLEVWRGGFAAARRPSGHLADSEAACAVPSGRRVRLRSGSGVARVSRETSRCVGISALGGGHAAPVGRVSRETQARVGHERPSGPPFGPVGRLSRDNARHFGEMRRDVAQDPVMRPVRRPVRSVRCGCRGRERGGTRRLSVADRAAKRLRGPVRAFPAPGGA